MGFRDWLNGGTAPISAGHSITIGGQRVSLDDLITGNKADRSAVLAACIDKITSTAGTVPVQEVAETGDPVGGSHLASMFNGNVNPDLSGHMFINWVLASLCTPRGQAFAFIKRKAGADISDPKSIEGIYPFLGSSVIPVFPENLTRDNPSAAPEWFKATVGNTEHLYAPDEILWFRRTSPDNPYIARNPLKPAEPAVAISNAAMEYLGNALTDGVSAGGVLHLGQAGQDPAAAASAAHRKMSGPANAKRIVYTHGETKPEWIPFGLSPVDLALVQVLDLTDKQVVMALGVPRDLIFSESKYENREAGMTELWSDANLPLLRIIEAEVTAKALRFQPTRFGFDLSEVAALEPKNEERATKAAQTNSVLVDEVRAMMNKPPLPNGMGQVIPAALLAQQTSLAAGGDTGELVRHILASTSTEQATVILGNLLARQTAPQTLSVVQVDPEPALALPTPDAAPGVVVRAKFDPASVAKTHERLERRGREAVKRLGEEQLEDVLNRLERVRSKGGPDAVRTMVAEATDFLDTYETRLAGYEAGTVEAGHLVNAYNDLATRAGLLSLFDPNKWTERTIERLRAFIERVGHTAAEQAAARFGVDLDDIEDIIAETVENRLAVTADLITATTAAAVAAAVIQFGNTGSEDLDGLGARLKSKFGELINGGRNKTIARTETVSGWGTAEHKVASASGVSTGRRWHSKLDDKVRDSHEDLHGTSIDDMVTKFSNGCLYPGDPDGPAAEAIGCRCVIETYPVK